MPRPPQDREPVLVSARLADLLEVIRDHPIFYILRIPAMMAAPILACGLLVATLEYLWPLLLVGFVAWSVLGAPGFPGTTLPPVRLRPRPVPNLLLEPAPPAPEVACNYCGEALELAFSVVCRRCQTPMHRDCWEEAKRCATYGCGCQDYDPPSDR